MLDYDDIIFLITCYINYRAAVLNSSSRYTRHGYATDAQVFTCYILALNINLKQKEWFFLVVCWTWSEMQNGYINVHGQFHIHNDVLHYFWKCCCLSEISFYQSVSIGSTWSSLRRMVLKYFMSCTIVMSSGRRREW